MLKDAKLYSIKDKVGFIETEGEAVSKPVSSNNSNKLKTMSSESGLIFTTYTLRSDGLFYDMKKSSLFDD